MKFTAHSARRALAARLFLAPAAARLAASRLMTPRQRAAYVKTRAAAAAAARPQEGPAP